MNFGSTVSNSIILEKESLNSRNRCGWKLKVWKNKRWKKLLRR